LLAGAFSGGVGGFLTNWLETLAVKKQTDSTFKMRKYMSQPGAFKTIFVKGIGFRTFYYSIQALIFFGMFEEMKVFLNVETMED
jgi:hypothetical protein